MASASHRRSKRDAASVTAADGLELPATLAFMRLLWAIDHGLRSVSKRMHSSIGLTGPQRLVLRIVGRRGKVTPSELATWLHLDRGTLSGILERLEARRLVLRSRHPEDGRSVIIQLSARGKLLGRETAGTVEAAVRRALATVPPSAVLGARQVLEAIAAELAKGGERSEA